MPIPPEPDPEPYAAPFNSAEIAIEPGTGASVVSTQVLVRFRKDVGNARREDIIKSLLCTVAGEIPEFDIYQLQYLSDMMPWAVADQFAALSEILWAETNRIVSVSTNSVGTHDNTGNSITYSEEPHFAKQWALHNTGQANGLPDADIDAPEAWNIEDGVPEVCIAILDTGVDYDHEDLAASLRMATSEGRDLIDGDNRPLDVYGHGTGMAGVAVSRVNAVGIAGVAPEASFYPVRIFDRNGDGNQMDVAVAMVLAVRVGHSKIISMSFGWRAPSNTLQDCIAGLAARGDVLMVASAGNSGNHIAEYPARNPAVICVAATDNRDRRSTWTCNPDDSPGSNHGHDIDVSAPGGSGDCTDATLVWSTDRHSSYDWTGGTSSATAFVSGVAALIWSLDVRSDNDYDLSASDVRAILIYTADPVSDPGMGSGRINACRALIEALRRLDIEETHKPFYVESANDLYMFVGIQGASDTHLGKLKTTTGATPNITDIAWDDSECALYATSFDQLYRIDMVTITLDPIGSGLGSSDVNGLTADVNGNLYAMTVDGELLRVNASTGIASRVGELGISITGSGDLAFSPEGSLYGAVRSTGSANDELVEVDTSDGSARRIGSIGYDAVFGLFFVGEDLYGVTADSELIAINTSTGTGALIRDLSFSAWGAQDLGE